MNGPISQRTMTIIGYAGLAAVVVTAVTVVVTFFIVGMALARFLTGAA